MRELTVRIRFTTPCLGHAKTYKSIWKDGKRKKRTLFLFQRSPNGRVIFMPNNWAALMRKAADVLCQHQSEVAGIRFQLEVDGTPQPVPDKVYRRYYGENKYSPHEAFYAGDVIGVSCLVPNKISDEDFWSLMQMAGQYYGMSPFRPGDFGHFNVEGIERRGPVPKQPEGQNELTPIESEILDEEA